MTTSILPQIHKKSKHAPPARRFGQCIVTVVYHKKTKPFYADGKVYEDVIQHASTKRVWTGKWIYKNKDGQTFLTQRQEFRILKMTGADEIFNIDDRLFYKTNFRAGSEAEEDQFLFITKGEAKRLVLKN